jgi:hypothetical protein
LNDVQSQTALGNVYYAQAYCQCGSGDHTAASKSAAAAHAILERVIINPANAQMTFQLRAQQSEQEQMLISIHNKM